MTNQTTEDNLPPAIRSWRDPLILLIGLALLIVAASLGFWSGTRVEAPPAESSPEVGFARDMAAHHAQAVNLATLLRDTTDDPQRRLIALDMMLTQQAQIGQMQGWLNVWKVSIAHTGPAMGWMGMPTTGLMPGMATPDQINQLRNLKGKNADGLFLSLMIPHHRGGVKMAQAILQRSQRPEVLAMAQSIVKAQEGEIALMQALLAQKGFPPAPDDSGMDHESMMP